MGRTLHTPCPWAGQPGTVQGSMGGRQWAPTSYPPARCLGAPGSSEPEGSTPRLQNNSERPRSPQKLCTGHDEGATSAILPDLGSKPRVP